MEEQFHEPSPTIVRKKQRDADADLTKTPHNFDLKSQGENNTERGKREDSETNQLWPSKKTNEECESTTMEVDVADLEQRSVAEKTGSLPSPQAVAPVYSKATYSAQTGGNVVAPPITNSNIGILNLTINSSRKESIVSSKEESVHVAAPLVKNEKIKECQQRLKETLKRRFEALTTGESKVPLYKVYTELCIIKGGNCAVNEEHEVIKKASTIKENQEQSIHCSQLFIPSQEQDRHIRTVVTRGVAGIGKTVSANKFALDWAEERENKNLDFVFPLPFCDLNLMRNKTISLVELLNVLFPETKDTGIFTNGQHKVLFIFDGLDESRLSLDFKESEIVTDVTQPAETAVLLTNIIRGRLLSSAFIWIISGPDASSKIPPEYIDLVIEVRGFNNPQKDEYFRSIINCRNEADKVITHVKSCQSLQIMCHIPMFCWMVASLPGEKLKVGTDMPATLTPMYMRFLTLCVNNMEKKLPKNSEANSDSVRNELISLGKPAFEALEKGHSIFNESSLIQNGIKVTRPTVFSGLYAQIFSEDLILCQEKRFCFVHMSVQEFFAALYVYLTFNNDNVNVLIKKSSISRRFLSRDSSEFILYKAAVKKALQCESGHFDMFLRFLLGLSLESNQTLLEHLMTHNRTNQKTRAEIIKYIKEKIKASASPDRCLNLYHCLNELNDHSEEIQSYFKGQKGCTANNDSS